MKLTALIVLLAGLVVLAGCYPAPLAPASTSSPLATPAPQTATAAPQPTETAGATPSVTPSPEATATPTAAATGTATVEAEAGTPTVQPGFNTHRDPQAGLAIDYPADWYIIVPPAEARVNAQAYTASIRSLAPDSAQGGGQAIPAGETAIDVTVSRTIATTFEELVAERRDELTNTEMPVEITSEEFITLPGGLPAIRWQLETSMAGTVLDVTTLLNGRRVMVTGMGELAQFDEIAGTLRAEGASSPTGPATPAATPSEGWKYTDTALGLELTLPDEWELCQDSGWSRLFCEKQSDPNVAAFPRFYVTALQPGFTNEDATAYNFIPEREVRALINLARGESLEVTGTPGYSTFTRLPDVTVNGGASAVVENSKVWEGGPATKDRRIFVKVASAIYMIGAYYETAEELAEVEAVLAGLTITPP